MRTLLASASTAVLSIATATAQLVVAPEGMAITSPTSSSLIWRSSEFRLQQIYDTTHFTTQGVTGPVTIHRLRFRAAAGLVDPGGQAYLGDGATRGVTIALGTSATDYLAASSTFAANRGVMQTVLRHGTVRVASCAGGAPNDYIIDVQVSPGVVYDPTLGQDLLLEIDGPPPTGTVPALACSSLLTTDRARRIGAGSQSAATGALSSLAGVVLFDITGGGGVSTIAAGRSLAYGKGCYESSRALAELWTPLLPFDLRGGGQSSIRFVPDVPGAPLSYRVERGSLALFTPQGAPLVDNAAVPAAMGNNATSRALVLGSAFPFVGGATSVVHANSNGYLELGAVTTNGGDATPTLAELAVGMPRLLPLWCDLDPSVNQVVDPLSGVHFDLDPGRGRAYITWLRVGEAGAGAGATSHTFQIELASDGAIEFRYPTSPLFAAANWQAVTGWTPGGGVRAPVSTDLTGAMPLSTSIVDRAPLTLGSNVPLLGATTALTVTNIPATAIATANMIAFTGFPQGFDLAGVGAPGCGQHIVILGAETQLLFGRPQDQSRLVIPNDLTFLGTQLYAQSASMVPGVNSLGILTSNALALVLGTVR